MADNNSSMGWEISRKVEEEKPSILQRLKPERRQIIGALYGVAAFFVVFLIGCWLAGNPL